MYDLERIKNAVNLESLAEALGVERKGRAWLCPLHEDHNPSFSIKGGRFKCFACDAHGDAFELVSRLRGYDFRQAVAYVADFAGVSLPSRTPPRRRPPRRDRSPSSPLPSQPEKPPEPPPPQRSPLSLLGQLSWWLRLTDRTPVGNPALQYLRRRGISPVTARAAGVGCLYRGKYERVAQLLRERAPLSELQALGLFNSKGNLRLYKHCLLFPCWLDGDAHGLLARNPNWRSKEQDGPKELLIGTPAVPYNCDALTGPASEVFLCEGAIDTLSLLEVGLAAVGVPGAMGFKPEWVPLFDGFEVVIAFDADDGGQRGTERIAQLFTAAGRPAPKVLGLPGDVKDVNELLGRLGVPAGGASS